MTKVKELITAFTKAVGTKKTELVALFAECGADFNDTVTFYEGNDLKEMTTLEYTQKYNPEMHDFLLSIQKQNPALTLQSSSRLAGNRGEELEI